MLVAFSISPSAADDESGSVSKAVARAIGVVRESGRPCETNAMFTNIEGDWDEIMAVVKRAVDVLAEASPRGSLVLKADIRPGYEGQLTAKVERVEQQLAAEWPRRPLRHAVVAYRDATHVRHPPHRAHRLLGDRHRRLAHPDARPEDRSRGAPRRARCIGHRYRD